uniref:Interleukin-7 receptor subunit alpha n=1 Tax=Elaeophora elaphi TaxID=1147741 RepID=A0A0R3S275_9BILA
MAIISLSEECDEVFYKGLKRATYKPNNLHIQVISSPKAFEEILQEDPVRDLCAITISRESFKITWILFDCVRNMEPRKQKAEITWMMTVTLIFVTIIVCVAIGACCYLLLLRNNHHKEENHGSKSSANKRTSTSGVNVDEVTNQPSTTQSPSIVSFVNFL